MKYKHRARLYATFGARLKKLRRAKKLTPTQFSEKCGIHRSNLAKYESGGREPGLTVIMIMAKSLGITHHELLDFKFVLPDSALRSK